MRNGFFALGLALFLTLIHTAPAGRAAAGPGTRYDTTYEAL